MPEPYGYELIMDLQHCNPGRFDADVIEQYCVELCDLIDMKREDFYLWANDPDDYDTTPPHIYGTSAVQFILTSSLVIHTLPKLKAAYVNIFSCKTFDPAAAVAFTTDFFSGDLARHHWIERL